ncbi:hypothetical protein TcCL_NonESM12981 [Trypanosoma cruzi]|nr:hypothetical protein TcCL_NonESM12981 [Trypanosoma cruzi]
MAPSQGNPDAVHDTQEPRKNTWQRYDRQPSSASERRCWWCVSKAESSPVASSQDVVSLSRGSALHNRQRHHTRTTHTRRNNKEARLKHLNTGEKGPHRLHIPIGSQTSGWWSRRCRAVRVACDCSGLRG